MNNMQMIILIITILGSQSGTLFYLSSRIDKLADRLDGRIDALGKKIDGLIETVHAIDVRVVKLEGVKGEAA